MALSLLPTAALAEEAEGEQTKDVAQIDSTKYASLTEAIEAAEGGATITLLADINTPDTSYYINKSLTIDLNGKTVTGSGYDGVFSITGADAEVCIKNGAVVAVEKSGSAGKYTMAVWAHAAGCKVTLEDLDISQKITSTSDPQMDMIYASAGTIIINSGSFTSGTPKWTLNINDGAYKNHTANIIVNGGTFVKFDPSDSASEDPHANFLAEGYGVKQVGDNYIVTEPVAAIGDTKYPTLAAAVATAQNGDTITLLKDTTESNIVLKKNGTLDLGGYTLNAGATNYWGLRAANGVDVTIKNGTVKNAYSALSIWGSNNSTAPTRVTVAEDVTFTESAFGIIFTGYSEKNDFTGKTGYAVLNFNGTITTGDEQCPIFVMGNLGDNTASAEQIGENGNQINIGATARITSKEEGIVLNGMAKLSVVDGATITGADAITMKRGYLNITGGTFTGTGDKKVPTDAEHSGAEQSGSAITVSSTYNYSGLIDVKISGGTFKSTNSYGFYAGQSVENGTAIAFTNTTFAISGGNFSGGEAAVYFATGKHITGGYFTSDPSAYVAESKYVIKSDKAGYTYAVTGTEPEKTPIFVDENTTHDTSAITDETTKNAIDAVINKAKVEGVAAAVDESALVASKVDASEVDAAKKVDVEVSVKVEVKSADLSGENAAKTLTFEAKPVATITVTKSDNSTETKSNVPVPNSLLSGEITVKLPLPTVNGSRFTPKQILHKFTGGGYEYFINESVGGMRGAGRFKIEDNCAVFTIYGFSTFELSGTVTYVEPSYSSGSSYDPTYSVTVDKTKNGTVTVSPKSASKGDTVTVTVKPDSGYVLETLTVTDKNGNELTLKDKGNGKYTFTMPAGKVEVKATFMEDNSMLNFFYDVPNNAYFYEAVKWAVENGITTGVGNDLFAPEQPCTRAQIVTFLWRAAGSPEPKGAASGMTDVVSGSYYEKAVAWAIENGITTGTTTSTFSPDATCTRAQAVTFLARALKAKAASAAEFSDVPTDSYFADAVAWAAANGVTEGIGGGLFGSDNDCTRGQIVTFLYRAYNK